MTLISAVRVIGLRYPSGPIQRDNWGNQQAGCLISVDGSSGHSGHAMIRAHGGTSHVPFREFVEHILADLIIGRDIGEHGKLWDQMMGLVLRQRLPIFPVSGIDVALWDLRGKSESKSIAQILSPKAVSRAPVYSSIPRIEDPMRAAEEAAHVLDSGFVAVKLHSLQGTFEPNREELICRTVRRELGPEARLIYDASCQLDRANALRMGRILEDLDYSWFEEPFLGFSSDDYRWLRDRIRLPLAGFETTPGGPDAAVWAMHYGGFDKIIVDCYWKGGITGAWRVLQNGGILGHDICMHHGGSASMNIANIHVVAASEAADMVELLTPVTAYNPGIAMPELARDGSGIAVPDAPGLGCEVDWDFVDSHRAGSDLVIQGGHS